MNPRHPPRSLVQRPETGHEAHSNTDAPKDGNGLFKQSPDKSNNSNDSQDESSEHKARANDVAFVQQEHQSGFIPLGISLGVPSACHNARYLPSVAE